jgi:hypothetical protein
MNVAAPAFGVYPSQCKKVTASDEVKGHFRALWLFCAV